MIELVEGPITVALRGPLAELEKASDELSFRPENYWRATSYQLYEQTNGEKGWDGYLRPLRIRTDPELVGYLPRGLVSRLETVLDVLGIRLEKRLLANRFVNMVPDDLPDDLLQGDLPLDEDQRTCIAEWLSCGLGIHAVTVGGGKTAAFAGAAELLKRQMPTLRILYVTHTERLVRQSFKEFKRFLPHRSITQFGGGVRDPSGQDIVVSTNAILYRNIRELVRDGWFRTFGAVMYDEVHHAASDSAEKVLSRVTAYYRFGASDSVKEDDEVARMKIEGHFGPVRHRVEPLRLILEGRLASPHIYIVDVHEWQNKYKDCQHVAQPDTPGWVLLNDTWQKATYLGPVYELDRNGQEVLDRKGQPVPVPSVHKMLVGTAELEVSSRWCLLDRTYDKAIIRFRDRNQLIVDWATYYSKQGWPTLVVATRTLHVMILAAELKRALGDDKVRMLFSDHNSDERDETFNWFKSTPGSVLVTPLVKEGVSINELRAGIIADPVSSWEYAKQLIGRFIRKKSTDNHAHITWFLDRQVLSYRRGCYSVFDELQKVRGFNFYHPCRGPETIATATRYMSVLQPATHAVKQNRT